MSIEAINIVMHTHSDFGYTDYPLTARRFLKEYVSEAIEYAERYRDYPEEARFRWTLETLLSVRDWWEEASETDRARLLAAVDEGLIEISGLPFNITAFLCAEQWDYMLRWIPRPLFTRMHIQAAMQIDINGLHTAGMTKAYDAGIKSIWIGANTYNGAPPIPTPALANWRLDDERTMRVWINASYCDGYFLFEDNWRQGPVPNACDLRYRKPGPGDFFRADEASVRRAHANCLRHIAAIEGAADASENAARDGFTQNKVFGGYTGRVLAVSITNQWRIDNDPPCWWICDFVKTWNALSLKPALRIRTVSAAMDEVEAGLTAPPVALAGEWTDWWANGNASAPSELAYAREAKRLLAISRAPLFGPWSPALTKQADEALYNLCMFDEHSFGAWQSVAFPDSFENRAAQAEKSVFAYRALNLARELLHARALSLDNGLHNAVRVANPTGRARSFVIKLPKNCLRGDYTAVENEATGERIPLLSTDGIANFLRPKSAADFGDENMAKTFSDSAPNESVVFHASLPPQGVATYRLLHTPAPAQTAAAEKTVLLETDALGWPTRVTCNNKALSGGTLGDFYALHADGFSPRWTFRDIFDTDDATERARMYRERTRLEPASYGQTVREDMGRTLRFTQPFTHPSLAFGKRILTVDTDSNALTLTLRFYRKANPSPELYYIAVDSPVRDGETYVSNADKPFRPGADQLPGSCRDYYAIDGWVLHQSGAHSHFVSSRDAALIAFGEPSQPRRRTDDPTDLYRMYFQAFDNTWDTNFNANAFGTMSFTFDIAADVALEDGKATALDLAADPVVIVRTGYEEA